VFDSESTNVLRSLMKLYDLWYVLATLQNHIHCSLQLLRFIT